MPSLPRAIHGLGIADGSGDTPAPAGGPRKEKYRIMDKEERDERPNRCYTVKDHECLLGTRRFVDTVAAIDHSSRGASSLSAI